MANEKKPKAAGGGDKGLKVTSRPATFRRGGFTFTGDARVISLEDMTQDQYDLIVNEPMLVSTVVDIAPPAEEKPKK